MAIAPPDPRTYRTTFQKSVAILKPRRDLIEPSFLYYLLHFDNARLSDFAAGTTQKNLLLKDLRSFVVEVPDLSDQRAIAHILGTLDDKIELNRRMNETLEAMARALFKSWFVDFDPVRAKAEGRDPGLPKPMADLFPDRFDDSRLDMIPAGWRIGTLGDVAIHPRRGVQPSEIEPSTPYIALEHMPKRCIALADWGTADGLESNKFEFKKGEILFGKLRPYFHKVGMAPLEAIAEAFTKQILPAIDRIIASIYESRTLTALRDTLLPKLISGELRAKDGERFVEEVV